jgi:hypothetical protein
MFSATNVEGLVVSHWQIGDVRITKFVEKEFAGSVHRFLLLDAAPAACKDIEWLKPHFMSENGELRLSIHALVVETPSCRIIVDTCFGNCGQLRIELEGEPSFVGICHCLACQQRTGSVFAALASFFCPIQGLRQGH